MHTILFRNFKEFCHKFHLKKRLSTTYSDSATILPVIFVTVSFIKHFLRCF